mgnify:CR=1 FL=1|jgi:hypothetical protein|tara:strand:+ start:357 stop:641 length:285 start_codon:yes stop_codon:yes gene_type:complete
MNNDRAGIIIPALYKTITTEDNEMRNETDKKSYKVEMTQDITQKYYMYVKAEDEEEAYDVALKAHGCWTLDDDYDCNSDYFEIGNIKEEEEDGQ